MNARPACRPFPRTIEPADLDMIVGGTDNTPPAKTASTRGLGDIVVTKSADITSTNA